MTTKAAKGKTLTRGRNTSTQKNQEHPEVAIVALVEELMSVDTKSAEAKLNEYSFKAADGNRIIYMLTDNMLPKSKKNKKDYSQKWIELIVWRRLLAQLFTSAREALTQEGLDDSYGYAVERVINLEKLIRADKSTNLNRSTLYASALFMDLVNPNQEGKQAQAIAKVEYHLSKIKDFPKDKINKVVSLIKQRGKGGNKPDEVILNTANAMLAFSPLSLVRLAGDTGNNLEPAINKEINYLDATYKRLKLPQAQKIARKQYETKRQYLQSCLNLYR